ncbi:MAG: leucyl aminopeptidase [Bryobacteraceae bacterium]|nr:leucyl aminopeptidase [Bryobacteraceae bacterium]
MDITIRHGNASEIDSHLLTVVAFERVNGQPSTSVESAQVNELYDSGEFSGKPDEFSILHRPEGLKAKRLMLAGAGKQPDFTLIRMRNLAGAAVRAAAAKGAADIHFYLPETYSGSEWARAAAEGAVLGSFDPDALKTDPQKNEKRVCNLTVCAASPEGSLEKSVTDGRIVGEAQNFARELVNLPANLLTPLVLAERAEAMAAEVGLECEVLLTGQLTELKMGALLGVAQGSDNPPALIVLTYRPARAIGEDVLALVGKGVTFDTGGISIKPADGMEKMKYDMGGAAAVLGAMRAIAQMKPNVPVTAYIPTVENMLSGRAQRPGDIVTSMCGKTIEVLNTDAEGRLILADALTYAVRKGATHLVDAATLTGAVAIALGHLYYGGFSNNDALCERVLAASRKAGERMWRFPMDADYKDYLKSAFADLPNIGGRWGGSITAAKFLEEFVEGKPWVHLDIAGVAWLDDPKPYLAKGPTGTPVRTFVSLAMDWAPQA